MLGKSFLEHGLILGEYIPYGGHYMNKYYPEEKDLSAAWYQLEAPVGCR